MFLLFEFVCGFPPSCLKVVGWWWWWVVGGGGGLQHFSVSPSPLLVLVLVLVLFGTWSLTILVCLLIINGCRHFLLYPFHLTDTPYNCILPVIGYNY